MIAVRYQIIFVPGWAKNSHFGCEIMNRISYPYGEGFPTLEDARRVLRGARDNHGGLNPGRFDIVASQDGRDIKRYTWE